MKYWPEMMQDHMRVDDVFVFDPLYKKGSHGFTVPVKAKDILHKLCLRIYFIPGVSYKGLIMQTNVWVFQTISSAVGSLKSIHLKKKYFYLLTFKRASLWICLFSNISVCQACPRRMVSWWAAHSSRIWVFFLCPAEDSYRAGLVIEANYFFFLLKNMRVACTPSLYL